MRRLYNCGFHMGQINVGNMGGQTEYSNAEKGSQRVRKRY